MNDKLEILVTGASGLVGNAIIAEVCKDEQFEVTAICGKNKLDSQGKLRKLYQLDISDYQSLNVVEELKKIDVIIHSAGLAHQFGNTKKEDFWRVNVVGTENICKLAVKLKAKHLVLISSVSVYGNYGNIKVDETFECQPEEFYAESKLEAEKTAVKICESANINLTILRLATVIGEGDRGNVARLIDSINKGRFVWIGKGENKKSLIYKGDAAKAVMKIIENQTTGNQIFNVTAKSISMKEIVNSIAESLPKKLPPLSVSTSILNFIFRVNKKTISLNKINSIERTVEKWLADDIYSGEKLSKFNNFKPATTIAEAIEKEVNHFKKSLK